MENKTSNERNKGNDSITRYEDKYLCKYWTNLPNGTRKHLNFYTKTRQEAENDLWKQLTGECSKYGK